MATRNWKRWLVASVATLGTATAAVGFLHTSAGRPLLAKIGGCPVGNVDPAAVQQGTAGVIAAARGTGAAPARPALGFHLDLDTFKDVEAWADAKDLECKASREDTLYKCVHVPATALPSRPSGDLDELTFGFRSTDGKLWSVAGWTFGAKGTEAAARLHETSATLATALGAPHRQQGDFDLLARGESGAPSAEYRYSDYLADLSGSSVMGRIVLREQYTSGLLSTPGARAEK